VPADSAAAVVKFTISIPRESYTNAKAKYSSSVVPPDPSVHFCHCTQADHATASVAIGHTCAMRSRKDADKQRHTMQTASP